MSRYEWEQGYFKLPQKEFTRIKRLIRDTYNGVCDELYQRAAKAYEEFCSEVKGKKADKRYEILRSCLSRHLDTNVPYNPGIRRGGIRFDEEQLENVCIAMTGFGWFDFQNPHQACVKNAGPLKVKKPAKNFSVFKHATNKDNRFRAGLFGLIVFVPDEKKIVWRVEDNNHSVEDARSTTLGRTLFKALDRCAWTSRTGGYIVGSDEYVRDSGGGEQIKEVYGKCTKDHIAHSAVLVPPRL